jgi:hypothetical protein
MGARAPEAWCETTPAIRGSAEAQAVLFDGEPVEHPCALPGGRRRFEVRFRPAAGVAGNRGSLGERALPGRSGAR